MVFLRKSQSWAAFATVTLTGAPSLPSIRTGVQGQLIPQINSSSDFRAGPLAFGAPFMHELLKELSLSFPIFQGHSHWARVGGRAWHPGPGVQLRKGPFVSRSILPPISAPQMHFTLWNRGPCGKPFDRKLRVFLFTLVWRESRQFCRVDVKRKKKPTVIKDNHQG